MCYAHYARLLKTGSVGSPHVPRNGGLVCYIAAHIRVRKARGRAVDQACSGCGEPAHQWSYDYTDPDQVISDAKITRGCAYSLDPKYYRALCGPCHVAFDLVHGQRRREKAR